MNVEKLKRLQSQVRIGGKGTPRRKKKVMHQTAAADDKKLQSSLKKLSVSTIPGIEEVNIIKDDLTVIHFNNPKAQASLSANTFAVTGHGETKKVVEMLPEILPQLGQDTVAQLRMFASSMSNNQSKVSGDKITSNLLGNIDEDDVPLLVNDFDEIAKKEDYSKGKKCDKKDDSQPAKHLSSNVKALNNQEKSLPPGVKKPNANIESTSLETSKNKSEKQPVSTDTNLKSKGSEKSKNASIPAKGDKKELNAQKGGANLKNSNQVSTQNQKAKTVKSSPENLKHESKSKSDSLNVAPSYDLKDILNSLPLSEVTGINVDSYAYVDRSLINSSAVKNNIATSPCPVQDVCSKPNLSPIDNTSTIKSGLSLDAVKPNLNESQLTDLMKLDQSKDKEMKKSNTNLQQMVQTANNKVAKKDVVQKDDKKPQESKLPSSAEVTTKASLTSGNKADVLQGKQSSIPIGTPVKLENKTEEVKDVKANIIPVANQASVKKEDEVLKQQVAPLSVAGTLGLENKTISTPEQQRVPQNIPSQQVTPDNAPLQVVPNKLPPEQVTQNSPLQQAAQNTTRLVAATLGLENKENLHGLPAGSSQSNNSLGLPVDMKAVPQPNVTPISSLSSIAPTVSLEPSKEAIMQTKSVPKEQPKVESAPSTPDLNASTMGTISVADESSAKEQMMANPSVVPSKPQPSVSTKTAIQKTPTTQPKKASTTKDNGKQQVKTVSSTTPKIATDAAKKTETSAKSKPMKPQAPTAPSQSTGATAKPQTTSKSPPANPAAKQEKPVVTPRVKTSMSGQTKQQSPATPKPTITTQQKKSPASPPLNDPSTKAGATSVKSTALSPDPKLDNNNLIKDKQGNPQKVGAAESATKSASPPKATQPKIPEDQKKSSQ